MEQEKLREYQLQIGDWVLIKGSNVPVMVCAIDAFTCQIAVSRGFTERGLINRAGMLSLNVGDLAPCPLEEWIILNCFPCKAQGNLRIEPTEDGDTAIIEINCGINGECTTLSAIVSYVHELQHFLRACGYYDVAKVTGLW